MELSTPKLPRVKRRASPLRASLYTTPPRLYSYRGGGFYFSCAGLLLLLSVDKGRDDTRQGDHTENTSQPGLI